MFTALYCWCKFTQLSCSLAVSWSVMMLRFQLTICAIYSYTNPLLLMEDILFCDWPMANIMFTLLYQFLTRHACSCGPYEHLYILLYSTIFFLELDRTQLSACMNLKTKQTTTKKSYVTFRYISYMLQPFTNITRQLMNIHTVPYILNWN